MAIKRVGIVGSGIMGAGIAETAASSGFEVVLRSRSQSSADAMVAALEKSLAKQVDKEKITAADRDATLSRVTAVSELSELAGCDLVIESVVEDLGVKKHLFTELDRICADHTILATNTSTLAVVEMAMETGRPEKVCGIHFFNPAPVMALVEVVRPLTASDDTIAAAVSFAEACGKTPVEVKDQAGFIVNSLAVPLLEQRRASARERGCLQRGHRRRDEGRVRVPHGPLRPPRPGGPGHLVGHPRRALRRVP